MLLFIHKGPIGNKSYLIEIMALHRASDKALPEPMVT